jgi:hypothetical protein
MFLTKSPAFLKVRNGEVVAAARGFLREEEK